MPPSTRPRARSHLQERHVIEVDARLIEALPDLGGGRSAAALPPREGRGRAAAESLLLDVRADVRHVRPAAAARGHGRQLGREAELVDEGVEKDHLGRAAGDDQLELLERLLELGGVGRVNRHGDDARPQAAEEHREEAKAEVEGQHDPVTLVQGPLHPQEVRDLKKSSTARICAGARDKLGRPESRLYGIAGPSPTAPFQQKLETTKVVYKLVRVSAVVRHIVYQYSEPGQTGIPVLYTETHRAPLPVPN